MNTSLQIHLCISPTPSFFTMVHYFAASLRRNGGRFADARIIVSVGDDIEPYDLAATVRGLDRYDITWRWVDRAAFREHSYSATGLDRFAAPFECDYVVMADADVLIAGDLSDLVETVAKPDGVSGVIATYPPFMARGSGNVDHEKWTELFAYAGLPPPRFEYRYPGADAGFYAPDAGMAEAPCYFNYGFVFGTRGAMAKIATTVARDNIIALEFMQTDLCDQAGLTLSIVRNDIAAQSLPVRYNFWNTVGHIEKFPADRRDIRVLHYLYPAPFAKHRDTASHAVVGQWLDEHRASDDPVARLIREVILPVHELVGQDLLEA